MRLRDSKVAKLLCKDCEIDELFKYMQDDGVRLLMGSSNIAAAKKKEDISGCHRCRSITFG